MTNGILTQQDLKEQLHYDKNTGLFTRIKIIQNSHAKVGDIAGNSHHSGYVFIRVNGKLYQAHRLAFLYMTGNFPVDCVDHINGIKNDNKWCNLRNATRSQNMKNRVMTKGNKTGYKGVVANGKKFKAVARLNGKPNYLGTFKTAIEAHEVYKQYAKKHHGEFYRD